MVLVLFSVLPRFLLGMRTQLVGSVPTALATIRACSSSCATRSTISLCISLSLDGLDRGLSCDEGGKATLLKTRMVSCHRLKPVKLPLRSSPNMVAKCRVLKEHPLPQLPSTPPVGWMHVKVEVVLRNPKMAIAILAQGKSLDTRERERAALRLLLIHSYMQEEEDPLFHELSLHTLIAWTRWWHLSSKALVLVLKKRIWEVVGSFLRDEKGRTDNRIALLREPIGLEEAESFESLTRLSVQPKLIVLVAPRIQYRMTDQNVGHPTLGRRRRHKSPPRIRHTLFDLVQEKVDHLEENATQSESSLSMQLEISDLKAKVLRLTEQYTEHDGKVNHFSGMSEQVSLIEQQIHRWRYRLPDLSDDDSRERVISAVEVKEDLDKFKDKTMEKVREVSNARFALESEVRLFERARHNSWKAVSQRVSTLVDDSVGALSERLADLEHTVQSRMTTPVTEESATHVEAWATIEQALVSEIGKVRDDHTQSVSRLSDLFEKFGERQKSLERQLSGLRSFARHVEQFLEQPATGRATAPSETLRIPRLENERTNASQGHVSGTSGSSTKPPSSLQVPRPPTIPAPPVPPRNTSPPVELALHTLVQCEVKFDLEQSEFISPTRNLAKSRKRVRDIGSLIFETPIQHDYEAGVEVRSLLPTERLEEMDGRLAVTDEDPRASGVKYAKLWVDEVPNSPEGSRSHADEEPTSPLASARDVSRVPTTPERRERMSPEHEISDRNRSRGSPDFGGGVGHQENDVYHRGHIPESNRDAAYHRGHIPESNRDAACHGGSIGGHIPESNRASPRPPNNSRVPPEDQVPRGCSLHSMEPLREWFCKGADMTSPAEYEAALCQLEGDPPDIRQYNANIREERLLIGRSKVSSHDGRCHTERRSFGYLRKRFRHSFPADIKSRSSVHSSIVGRNKRTLEVYRRVDETTKDYPWSVPITEERWHPHAEGVLMVALTTLNLPAEAWKSARLLRAVPNCRLELMLSYHMLSPVLSVEETGLMAYLQTPPEAGPSVVQVTSGLQHWKCAGRRLVEIGGRLRGCFQIMCGLIVKCSKICCPTKHCTFCSMLTMFLVVRLFGFALCPLAEKSNTSHDVV